MIDPRRHKDGTIHADGSHRVDHDRCLCDGCWGCKGNEVGCTCDIDWDCVYHPEQCGELNEEAS